MRTRARRFECQRDGLTIRGKIYGDTGEARPVVILCHGFLADQSTLKDYARLAEAQGYIALTFDFCGGGIMGRSDGKSRDMTVFTEMEDLRVVMDYVKDQPFAAGISLWGFSQGGFVSAMTAKKYPDEIDRLILIFPALCIPDDARRGKMMFYEFDPDNIPDILGRIPMELGGGYARAVVGLNVFDEIGGYEGPVLYIHGTADDIVPVAYARKAKDLYPNCEYHEIVGGGHGFKGKYDREACALIEQFLAGGERA